MKVYKFQSGRRYAWTNDKTGANLPASDPAWRLIKLMDIDVVDGPRIGSDSADIVAAIERDGYIIRPKS